MRSLNIFLLLYFIGNSNYLIINCVPKLVWGCSQAIRLRHINKVFYSVLFLVQLFFARLVLILFFVFFFKIVIVYEAKCFKRHRLFSHLKEIKLIIIIITFHEMTKVSTAYLLFRRQCFLAGRKKTLHDENMKWLVLFVTPLNNITHYATHATSSAISDRQVIAA